MCGAHCELDICFHIAHLHASPFNRVIEGCISMFGLRISPNYLEAEFGDIWVAVAFAAVSSLAFYLFVMVL